MNNNSFDAEIGQYNFEKKAGKKVRTQTLSFETLVNSNSTAKQCLEHPWAFD